MTSDPQVPPEPEPIPVEQATVPPPKSAVHFTRTAAAWWALIVGLFFLVVLLIFIAQNTDSISIDFLAWEWTAPVAVAFLIAAVCGAAITVLIGSAYVIQLRRAAKKNLRAR